MQEVMRQQQEEQQQQKQELKRETIPTTRRKFGIDSFWHCVYASLCGCVVRAYVCISGAACDGALPEKKTEQKAGGKIAKYFVLAAGPMGNEMCAQNEMPPASPASIHKTDVCVWVCMCLCLILFILQCTCLWHAHMASIKSLCPSAPVSLCMCVRKCFCVLAYG